MKLLNQNYVKYGLYMSLVTASCLLLMELTGQNQSFDNKSPIQVIFMFIAPFILWFLGIQEKKKQLKNRITFKQGLSEGFKISLVYAIVSPFIFLFYYLFVNPPIVEFVKTAYNMTTADIGTVIGVDMLIQFLSATIFGTIYAAIIAAFLKTKKK